MIRPDEILNNVKVATPCRMSWERMTGDDQVRFCQACKLNVYNLSGMTAEEAARLVSESEGRMCVRFYRRADGRMLTRDCPEGVRAVRKRLAYALSCAVVMFSSLYAFASRLSDGPARAGQGGIRLEDPDWRAVQPPPIQAVLDRLYPLPPPKVNRQLMLGAIALPVTPPAPITGRISGE
jgi:hypothetical protein